MKKSQKASFLTFFPWILTLKSQKSIKKSQKASFLTFFHWFLTFLKLKSTFKSALPLFWLPHKGLTGTKAAHPWNFLPPRSGLLTRASQGKKQPDC